MHVDSEMLVPSGARQDVPPFNWPSAPKVKLGATGADSEMSDLEREMQKNLHAFAEKVMRPIGAQLDRMSAEDVVAADSPYWRYLDELRAMELSPRVFLELSPLERGRLFPIVLVEMGWGDGGLSIIYGACSLPPLMALVFNRRFLIERFPDSLRGCWAITEPDHGSDSLDVSRQAFHAMGSYGRPNCVATIRGDKVVINGQKSAWVSNAPTAEVCVLYCAADTGSGADTANGVCMLVPMDAPGVSRGRPLEKIGQRALPQGEVYFDNVELNTDYVVAGPEDFQRAVYFIHSEANAQMACIWTGVARAAYEMAFEYAHQRKQGGVPIIRHQAVASRLFHMYRKVEASRALARRVCLYNHTAAIPALQSAMAAKITGTQTAFEVASEALQIFGGNGLTREYPIEKLLRDARASMIEDGCNDLLAIKAGFNMIDPDLF
ncbi:acyl-CoA dehydrogenase family protein [Methyloversatilis discipulorum]|uniref:acyl-CoA dehydrogenase family protein n=1 Tax=Methyloversatilis discipulorum TaxID=1119528 RepID=UPI003AF95BCE